MEQWGGQVLLRTNYRSLYLNELRPPEGYHLDKALATTYTLDLLSLLMAPLSMVFYEAESSSVALKDPTAVLEALRRVAGRLAVFTQQGRIAIPGASSLLFSYLEAAVVEVRPRNKKAVFHPKTWLLRFAGDGLPTTYRFLCLSRNLTFDKSWDTVLCLEGTVLDRRIGIDRNRPLVDFVRSLPGFAVRDVPSVVTQMVDQVAGEVSKVRFESPAGFNENYTFKPVGIPGHRRPFFPIAGKRTLVLSPFLSENALRPLATQGKDNVLISRAESLDGISDKALEAMMTRTSVYAMEERAQRPEETDSDSAPPEEGPWQQIPCAGEGVGEVSGADADLSGLHAKMYIAEEGWEARLLTGSGNATAAANTGGNVEFLVELTGQRAQMGIDRFMGSESDKNSFRNLLVPYSRTSRASEDDGVRQELEDALDLARQAIAESGLCLDAVAGGADLYSLTLSGRVEPAIGFPALVTGSCFPISIGDNAAKPLEALLAGQLISFQDMSLASLTGFIAFRLTASVQKRSMRTSFVMNLPVCGMPEGRERRVLEAMISDEGRFIRYLLFLLADQSDPLALGRLLAGSPAVAGNGAAQERQHLPLLEELVRAFSRNPDRLDRIGQLVQDLRQSDQGRSVLPEGFEGIWDVIMSARGEGGAK